MAMALVRLNTNVGCLEALDFLFSSWLSSRILNPLAMNLDCVHVIQ